MLTASFIHRVLPAPQAQETTATYTYWSTWQGEQGLWLQCNRRLVCLVSALPAAVVGWLLEEQPDVSVEGLETLTGELTAEQAARVLTIFIQGGIGDANA